MKMILKQLRNQKGFSLIEIMIAITIMGLLMGVVAPRVVSYLNQASIKTTKVVIKGFENALKSYRLDCGQYPTTDQGLDALVTKPATAPECKNYAPDGYIEKVQKDAWDNDFLYTSDGVDYEIRSLGEDKREGGEGSKADLSSKEQE